jgi:putative salt-induced outer membrane protein YdiY
LLLAAAPADTGSATAPRPPRVTFSGDAGFASATGNTSVQTLKFGDKILARVAIITFTQQFVVVHGRSNGSTVASNWRHMIRTDVALEQDVAAYASMTWERDPLAGLSSRLGAVTGLSADIVRTKTDKLVLEGGISLTTQRGTVPSPQDEGFLGGRAATAYVHQLGPRASIGQSIELLPNFREGDDLRINSETDLLAPITRNAAVKVSYVIRYDGQPAAGFYSTDRMFTSGIQVTL